MKTYKVLQWITGICEGLLAIPIIGGGFVVANLYVPLFVMLGLHIITLVYAKKEARISFQGAGSILGIITSCIAWIPFLGWFMHTITAIVLLVSAARKDSKNGEVEVID
ncbi:hypothetical protein [Alkalihalobacillus sp. AL-G]|uniref:hypothetical protein n=1 Tax=Alkalihalobacillus sp. AL-G TaxID=2926399 RepID=UPI002729E79C|nr:hypothetical protein [Alkalihalobacillus sp. AL-G]WLD93023.1 hypothetical protein MOJ78_18800 [Alkalihalobacillus sp. AL-G]